MRALGWLGLALRRFGPDRSLEGSGGAAKSVHSGRRGANWAVRLVRGRTCR
jgi:hypothetical protein